MSLDEKVRKLETFRNQVIDADKQARSHGEMDDMVTQILRSEGEGGRSNDRD